MITTIIPVYKLNKNRKRNLEFIYARLKDQLPDNRIIISVQSSSQDNNYYKKFDEVVYFKNSFKTFNKSALINYSLDNIEIHSDFLMLLDGDIYFKFKNLEDQIPILSDEKVIKPFSECVYLTEPHTLEFINKRKITLSGGLKKISALGGGAIILKSSLIKDSSVRYDENFSGWGWEDIDFGDNIRSKFSIKTLQQPAVHLYHPVINEPTNNYFYYKHKNKPKNKIVHTFSHACVDKDHRLHSAQTNALESLFVAKKHLDVLLLNACSEFCINNDNIKTIQLNKTAKDIGYERDLPYLDDVVNSALPYVEDDGWVVYTNSDCVVEDKFYENILKYNYDYIEFKRQDVDDKGNHLRSISRGVDGFAIRKKLLEKIPMPKLIIGAPYWDDVVSKIYSKTADKFMIINNELTHLDHKSTYDLNKLDIAGEFNYKQLVVLEPSLEVEKNIFLQRIKIISDYVENQTKEIIRDQLNTNNINKHTEKRKNALVLSMCLNQEKKPELYGRELLCLESLKDANACEIFNNITIIVNDLNDKHRFLMQRYLPYANLVKAKEQFTSFKELSDTLDFLSEDNFWLTYINSDCCVKTLSFLNSNPAILYRQEVDCVDPKSFSDLYSSPRTLCLTGIDGFYCPLYYFKKLSNDDKTNFYFGNPAWDVVLGIRLINDFEVVDRIRDELYHLKHDPVWKNTIQGSAIYPKNKFIDLNNKLYIDELDLLASTNSNKKVSCINISENEPINKPKNKIRIIIPFHPSSLVDDEPLRIFAFKNCLLSLLRQGDIDYHEIVVVEARLKNKESIVQPIVDEINKYNNIFVISIESSLSDCKYYSFIYQKEVLLNIGAEHSGLNSEDILTFLDSDILIRDPSWLKTVYKKFDSSDGELLLYPWRKSQYLDVFFGDIHSVFSPSEIHPSNDKQGYFNPGMCVSLRKKDFKGMPEWFYLGGGDTAFLYMHGQQDDMMPSIMTIDHYAKEILSIQPKRQKYSVKQIPVDICHMWHGSVVNYSIKFDLMSNFYSDIRDLLEKESSGLIRWKTISCKEYNILFNDLYNKISQSHIKEIVEKTNSMGMNLVEIKGGSFNMGDASNVYRTTISQNFWMAKTTVTQDQWFSVMSTTPWRNQNNTQNNPNSPATFLTWDMAIEFCKKLTEKEIESNSICSDFEYTLPTEAEWEYCCRSGTITNFSFGKSDSYIDDFAWHYGNTRGEQYPHEVSIKKPNLWGLYDMHGNVWEWCKDFRLNESYSDRLKGGIDPIGMNGDYRPIRGGSWQRDAIFCRSAYRPALKHNTANSQLGFRVILKARG